MYWSERCEIHTSLTRFLRNVHHQEHCELGQKGKKRYKVKEAAGPLLFYWQRAGCQRGLSCRHLLCFMEKGRMAQRVEGTQGLDVSTAS